MNKKVLFIRVISVVLLILVIIALWDFFIQRRYRNHLNAPNQQFNTEWKSTEDNIYFNVGDKDDGIIEGVLMSNEKQIDIVISFAGSQNMIYIHEKSSAYDHYFHQTEQTVTYYNVTLVKGSFNMIGKDKCIVKIKEKHPTLEVDLGKKIVFIKTGDGSLS